MLSRLSGVDLQMHPDGAIVYRFITDKNDIEAIFQDNVMKVYFPREKHQYAELKQEMFNDLLVNNAVVQLERAAGKTTIDGIKHNAYLAVYASINPLNASHQQTDQTMNSLILNVIYISLIRFSPSSIIPGTMLSYGTKFTDRKINDFDIALLRAVYSDEVESGMNRKKAAKKITELVYKELRR